MSQFKRTQGLKSFFLEWVSTVFVILHYNNQQVVVALYVTWSFVIRKHLQLLEHWITMQEGEKKTTHYLLLVEVPWAVSGGQGGGAGFTVPRDVAVLGGAADGQGVNAVGVAIAVAAVLLPASVSRRPHKDGTQTIATLEKVGHSQADRNGQARTFSLNQISSMLYYECQLQNSKLISGLLWEEACSIAVYITEMVYFEN